MQALADTAENHKVSKEINLCADQSGRRKTPLLKRDPQFPPAASDLLLPSILISLT